MLSLSLLSPPEFCLYIFCQLLPLHLPWLKPKTGFSITCGSRVFQSSIYYIHINFRVNIRSVVYFYIHTQWNGRLFAASSNGGSFWSVLCSGVGVLYAQKNPKPVARVRKDDGEGQRRLGGGGGRRRRCGGAG